MYDPHLLDELQIFRRNARFMLKFYPQFLVTASI